MILTCPECSARYVVDPKALLPNGRTVRCAKCRHSWKEPAPDVDVSVVDDAEAESPEVTEQTTEQPPTSDNEAPEKGEQDTTEDEFAIRRARRKKRPRPLPKGSNLPALQNHKHGGVLWGWYGLGAFVVIFISSLLIFQTSISEVWPPSLKLYRTLGLENKGEVKNNDPGQEQHDPVEAKADIPHEKQFKIENFVPSKVLNGSIVTLKVKGNIANLTDETLTLPLLKISLKDDQGKVIREWTFKPSAATISEGEKVTFSTSLPNPPEDATSISVTFAQK